ncbi:carbon monoxide dehydrogenase [Candidatus Acetothermia bacterium]|jgi:thiamine pyrophosphate-dependent acetolactate synthase large subunit-like protein|nr:carbon monoxide dehydrogenase [Candidatus Acetothermia bacterium]MCI2426654.1 carbon monoxide dehydrogenase [Candidatus Acetothermia bacterium]MCI2427846.1 carbon monoxide dehydrogenase [Candidatus Acetothermia bacterium]MCI2428926.1 carbon monoxide dehydrogenase [Candidatus Acetothermia bacterium]
MSLLNDSNRYQNLLSPEPILQMSHPVEDKALVEGSLIAEEEALQRIAEKLLSAKKPVIFAPGRIILWTWEEGAPDKAKVLRELAAAIGAEILPVMDIRPDYPAMRTAVEINPYHADLIIGHNRYDVAVFVGIDCPYADVALKIICDGTECYTIALCGKIGHVDATITLRDTGLAKLRRLTAIINTMKQKMQNAQENAQEK